MAERIRSFDWTLTPLGPIEGWSQSLKTVVDLMLASRSMMSLVWGPEAIHLYNDGFTDLLQEHRTLALGRSAYETFARSREVFEADIAAGMAGRSVRLPAQRYPVLRQGHLQDAWFDVDYAPIRDDAGSVGGVLWTLKETTAQHLAESALRASEARHRLLIESWAQAVWETDATGVVVADSPSWRAYTGQTLEEWLGYGWLNAIHPDDRAYAERQWRDAMTARSLVNAEFRLRDPNGSWRWTNVRAAPVLDASGDIAKWVGMNIDIDDRKSIETAMHASEEKYRTIFNSIDDGFCVIDVIMDKDGHPVDLLHLELNHAYERHTGLSNIVGKRALDLTPDAAAWLPFYGNVARTGHAARIEYRVEIINRWFACHASRIGGEGSQKVVVVFNDITDRKRAEEALRESEERQAFLLKLSDALRAEPDADAVANRALKVLLEQLGLDRCYITYYRPAEDEAHFPYQLGNDTVPPLPAKVRLSDFPEAYEQVLDRTFVLEDDFERRGLSEAERANSKALGMRAMVASTVRRGERRPLASMAAVSSRPRRWRPAEITLVEEAAERTWAAIERARVETGLRESEERFRQFA